MGVSRHSQIDCNRDTEIGNNILTMKEQIAHKRTYTEDHDADLMQIELNSLIEQQRKLKERANE